MALGINTRDRDLAAILRTIFDRLRRLEHQTTTHIGGFAPGYTISIDQAGQLIATSDLGNITVLAQR